MLGQHEVLAACQALCNSQADQQPKQPGTTTSGTGAELGPHLHPEEDASYFDSPQLFQTRVSELQNHELFHSLFKAVSSGTQPPSPPQRVGPVPLSRSVTMGQPAQSHNPPHCHLSPPNISVHALQTPGCSYQILR